jgi:GT2 family glycosyltransferase
VTGAATLTVGILTRNRPRALARCLDALPLLGHLVSEVIVVDDASDVHVGPVLARAPEELRGRIRLIEQPSGAGGIAGRNRMVREASNEFVLSLDDDAFVLESDGIRQGVDVLATDAEVAAVAFAQAEANGDPWPAPMQPAPVSYRCYVTAYIGFAHLLRRSAFLAAGGYDESFVFYGEEKDWCLRALHAGARVVYLPDVRVAHVPDRSGRNASRYLRYVIRNDCLSALRREPLPLPLVSVPVRLRRYFMMRRHGGVADPGGFAWLLRELAAALPTVRLGGRVSWATLRRWRRIHREHPAYHRLDPGKADAA